MTDESSAKAARSRNGAREYEMRRSDPEQWERKLEWNRQWRKRNAEKIAAYDKARRSSAKQRASRLIRNRVLRGKLQKLPCEICGDPNTHGHHPDYSKPAEVKWLCPKHHAEAHKNEQR